MASHLLFLKKNWFFFHTTNIQKHKNFSKFDLFSTYGHNSVHNTSTTLLTTPKLWLGVTLELRRTGGGGLTVLIDARRAIRDTP
jgi:hypothetical protein